MDMIYLNIKQLCNHLSPEFVKISKLPGRCLYCYQSTIISSNRMASLNNLIERRQDILGGTPVFKGTRVPVSTFLEYLEAGNSLNEFLEDFPTVTKRQAVQVLETFKDQLLQPQ